jgi:DNA-binding transcriptional ArsR family regulator
MFKSIFGSEIKGKILLFLYTNGESYPTEIARIFDVYLNRVQNHLMNMEREGLLYSKLKGKIRLFGINPRYPLKKELAAILEKSLEFISKEEKSKYYFLRQRPRRMRKPL